MLKRENIKLPGVISFLWAIISIVLGIYLHYKYFGEIKNSRDWLLTVILMSIFWIPVSYFLYPAWRKENEQLFFNRLEKLVQKGKYKKVKKLIKKHKTPIMDNIRMDEIKARIDLP